MVIGAAENLADWIGWTRRLKKEAWPADTHVGSMFKLSLRTCLRQLSGLAAPVETMEHSHFETELGVSGESMTVQVWSAAD